MNIPKNMNFNFADMEELEQRDYIDIFVTVSCMIILLYTIFFILIPEKNIEKSGQELDRFSQKINPIWVDANVVKAYPLKEQTKMAQLLSGNEKVENKIKFLVHVHAILTEHKNHVNKEAFLEQVMKDRKVILNYLVKEFNDNNETNFNCHLAACKDKEYKVTQEKLQMIKFVNLKLDFYYMNLANLYGKSSKNKVILETVKNNITPALTKEEMITYKEMKNVL